jgi:polar amino acid transport system permease protein
MAPTVNSLGATTSLAPYLPFILRGFLVTLEVFALGTLVWLPTGFLLGSARLSRLWPVRLAAGVVIETFRGTSALVQLFWAFYVLPLLGVSVSPLVSAVVVLGLNEGSYASEIVRGAVRSVPRGQREAATVLGLRPFDRFRYVVFPQAITVMIPSFGNSAIDFLKFTSLVSLVTLADVTLRAQEVNGEIGKTGTIYGLLLLVYFFTSVVIAQASRSLETYVRRRHSGRPARRRLLAFASRAFLGTRAKGPER